MLDWARTWVAPLALTAGLIALIWAFATPEMQRSFFQWGIFQLTITYDQAIPLFALGAALSRQPRLRGLIILSIFFAAFCLGLFGRSAFLPMIGPFSLIIAGVSLIIPRRADLWAIPLATAILAFAVAMTISFDAPPADDWLAYVSGASLSGVWLLTLAFFIWHALPRAWLMVATPIIGSWLIAIGLMLLGAALISRP
jgi:hypothetical protein